MSAALAVVERAGGGDVVTIIVLVVVVGIFGVAKYRAYQSTRCMHCGHDNGLTGFQAVICPACGRNKTIFNARKARKR